MSEKSLCGKKKKWDKRGEGGFEVTVKQAVKCSLRPAGRLDLASPCRQSGPFTHEQAASSG